MSTDKVQGAVADHGRFEAAEDLRQEIKDTMKHVSSAQNHADKLRERLRVLEVVEFVDTKVEDLQMRLKRHSEAQDTRTSELHRKVEALEDRERRHLQETKKIMERIERLEHAALGRLYNPSNHGRRDEQERNAQAEAERETD